MKKLLLGAIMAFLLSSSVSAYDQEITFNGIPWGCTYEEFQKQKDLYFPYESFDTYGYTVDEILGYGAGDNYAEGTMAYISDSGTTNVAGYDGVYATYYFANKYAENSLNSEKTTSFYGAVYEFEEISDLSGATEDLKNKLTSLYGECEDKSDVAQEHYIYTWKGTNDTECVLYANGIWENLQIAYAWRGGEEILKETDAIINHTEASQEKELYGNGDTNGL